LPEAQSPDNRIPATAQGCILVSGGSRGLGLGLSSRLLDRGLKVASFARRRTDEVASLEARYRERVLFAEMDALDEQAVRTFVRDADAWGDGIHGLVNNAAIGQDNLLAHTDATTIGRLLDINLRAPILLTKAVLKRMIVRGRGGRIVNVTSICGLRGYQGLTVYSATKGGLDAFTRALAREVGARQILVNSVAPGFFSSEMSAVLAEEQMQTIRRRTATGVLTEPEHVGEVVEMLLLGNSNITGQVIVVDGGSTT
jgi:3-oxoacyl-[acyl-carrier protein] reductase